ncbi:MAG: 3-hydroxyacyl-ACP dehydratase FabZ [Rhodospirillales bacterium]|nr:3-hydroxyacyl-ACP dehydratase FabZ [Alphaproteobacteria bacterium]MBL6947839.1 3-hydroxyacyl-ACP dehydratase FabZ [Rhodospirillales bacterium]
MDETPPTKTKQVLNQDDIKAMIPHRDPFLLIDEVRDLVPDEKATGYKNVTGEEDFFKGHFPGHPIMPGVLIVEAMAQTSAVLVIGTLGQQTGSVVYFMSVEQARFRKPVFPGNRLELHVDKLQNRGKVWKFEGKARVGDTLVAEAIFTAMIVNPK